jgi:hypothetical protein
MRTLLNAVSVLSLCASSFVLGGCEVTDCKTDDGEDAKCAESLKAYEATEQVEDVDYVDGASITIKGLYGDIAILPGDEGTVSTTFKPFNYRGHSQETDARRELAENLDLDVSADDDGNITVTTDRHDATNGLGSHITVRIPPEFNGTLIVQNEGKGVINPGLIDVKTVAESTTLNVVNHGLGLCSVLRGDEDDASIVSNLTDVDVRCEADIIVRGVRDNVIVMSRNAAFHSAVVVEIVGVSDSAGGGNISGENSDVQLTMPPEGDYEVAASLGDNARMNQVDAADCDVSVDEETELQFTCGAGGPRYDVSATGDDDVSRVNVYVR